MTGDIGIGVRLQTLRLAVRRRLSLLFGGGHDPYPLRPDEPSFDPSSALAEEIAALRPALAWRAGDRTDLEAWRAEARAKLAALVGFDFDGKPPETHTTLSPVREGELHRRRVLLARNDRHGIPVHLLWRGEEGRRRPVMLCLTGTNVGAHCAWGEALNPADPIKISRGLDIAVQAADRGYLAAVVEQMGFGERTERRLSPTSLAVGVDAAHHALLLGKTLLGLWMSDLSAVVAWLLEDGPPLEPDRIYAMGHSAGGTTALFTAAIDQRIKGVIASGCVGSWRRNIVRRRDPEGQLAIPGILHWLEMADILGLVAPRPLVVVSGERDHIWPATEAARVVEEAREIFEAAGDRHRLAFAAGPDGHRFYPQTAWPAFDRAIEAG